LHGEVAQKLIQVCSELAEAPEQHVGHAGTLQVSPQDFNEVQFRAVMRQPEHLHVLFGILEVVMNGLGVMRIALIHHQDDSPSRSSSTANELLQQDAESPCRLLGLRMVQERSVAIPPSSEGGHLPVAAGTTHPHLSPTRHPGPRQMGMKVELGFVLVPEFVIGGGVHRPLFRRDNAR